MAETNQHGLPRDVPDPIKRIAWQRSGFGCVVCGLGIYQYEHIDPEFKDAKEHNPDGITLLCGSCHDKKTRGYLSADAVKEAMKNPKCFEAGFAKEKFDVNKGTYPIIIFAGSIFTKVVIPVQLSGVPILKILPPEEEGAPLNISGNFFDSTGKGTLNIVNNEWMALNDNWDVETTGGKLIIRERAGKIHLILGNPATNILEIERIESVIGNTKIIGDKDKLLVFNPTDSSKPRKLSNINVGMAIIGFNI